MTTPYALLRSPRITQSDENADAILIFAYWRLQTSRRKGIIPLTPLREAFPPFPMPASAGIFFTRRGRRAAQGSEVFVGQGQ